MGCKAADSREFLARVSGFDGFGLTVIVPDICSHVAHKR